jgi:acyl-CoA thioester hydrolase
MRKRGLLRAGIEIKVPFYDVDSLNVAWHGHYAKYMEEARCALLDSIGYGYDAMRAEGYAWPVIDMHIRYAQPAIFGQRIRASAELIEWENRLVLNYLVTDAGTGTRLTRATTTQVPVLVATREMQLGSPPGLTRAVQAALVRQEAAR